MQPIFLLTTNDTPTKFGSGNDNLSMFRRQLSGVLLVLAACIVLQGVGAVFALREAERQVVRGRVASDIHQGFVQLSATKQHLRTWVTQHKIGTNKKIYLTFLIKLR